MMVLGMQGPEVEPEPRRDLLTVDVGKLELVWWGGRGSGSKGVDGGKGWVYGYSGYREC